MISSSGSGAGGLSATIGWACGAGFSVAKRLFRLAIAIIPPPKVVPKLTKVVQVVPQWASFRDDKHSNIKGLQGYGTTGPLFFEIHTLYIWFITQNWRIMFLHFLLLNFRV